MTSPQKDQFCLPDEPTFYGLAANTIFFDIAIILLPIPLFLKTQIPNRKKVRPAREHTFEILS